MPDLERTKTNLLLSETLLRAADLHLPDLAQASPAEVLDVVRGWHSVALADSVLPGLSENTLQAVAEILHERACFGAKGGGNNATN